MLSVCLFLPSLAVPAIPQTNSAQEHSAKKSKSSDHGDAQSDEDSGQPGPGPSTYGIPEDPPEDELAPAAMELDVSKSSPLIQTLYQATRETKEQPTLDRLAEAKKLIAGGADLKATDDRGRTALHWAIFGSSYATKPKVLVEYEEVADELIKGGVDINKEDVYQDTALDYLLYAPTFEMQTLLVENGATSGFLAAFYHYYNQVSNGIPAQQSQAIALSRKADLAPGATMSVRLLGAVYSDRSRTGDPVEAVVTYPVCKNGEQLACNPGELLVPPGTKVNGTVLFAAKAPDKYSRPRLVLDFSNILHKSGKKTPLYARVLDVDNARETVRNNEILGIVQPHASTKVSLAMMAISASNPIAGYTIKGVQTVYGLSIRREVLFPAGTDLQVQVVRASMLREKEEWTGWPRLDASPELTQLVVSAPMRTYTKANALSDPTNLMFLGSEQQLVSAFGESGWIEAGNLGLKSAAMVAQATIRQTGVKNAPVSSLYLQGRQPDLVFQKSLDTFAKRHHIRIWKLDKTYQEQQVWVGAATHDIATENSRGYTKWTHRIDPHIDRERDWIETDLLFSGTATGYLDIERPNAPRQLSNATGDDIVTDGKMTVVKLGPVRPLPAPGSVPTLTARPQTTPSK
jgi:LssY C-terminus